MVMRTSTLEKKEEKMIKYQFLIYLLSHSGKRVWYLRSSGRIPILPIYDSHFKHIKNINIFLIKTFF